MKVTIPKRHRIRIEPSDFEEISKGRLSVVPNDRGYEIGQLVIMAEHTGANFTGKEIVAEVKDVDSPWMKFRKLSITTETL